MDPAQGFAFWRGEDVLGQAWFHLVELLEGMEIADEATTVFAFHISKGGVQDRGVVPIGLGSLCVIDPGETLRSESWG